MHQARTSRPIDSQLVTRSFIMSIAPLWKQELSYSDPQVIYNPLKDTSMSKWLQSLYEYLLKFRGVNKCPLAYVARAQVEVKPHATYPTTEYETFINKWYHGHHMTNTYMVRTTRPSGTFYMMPWNTIHHILQFGLLHVPRTVGLYILLSHSLIRGDIEITRYLKKQRTI